MALGLSVNPLQARVWQYLCLVNVPTDTPINWSEILCELNVVDRLPQIEVPGRVVPQFALPTERLCSRSWCGLTGELVCNFAMADCFEYDLGSEVPRIDGDERLGNTGLLRRSVIRNTDFPRLKLARFVGASENCLEKAIAGPIEEPCPSCLQHATKPRLHGLQPLV